jgi:hypothetical protein
MVNFDKTMEGNLRIALTDEGRVALPEIESIRDRDGINAAFLSLIAPRLEHGWEAIRPEEIGALTDSLILGDDVERDDHGRLARVGRVYWNPDYAVRDEIEEIEQRGYVEYVGVE